MIIMEPYVAGIDLFEGFLIGAAICYAAALPFAGALFYDAFKHPKNKIENTENSIQPEFRGRSYENK